MYLPSWIPEIGENSWRNVRLNLFICYAFYLCTNSYHFLRSSQGLSIPRSLENVKMSMSACRRRASEVISQFIENMNKNKFLQKALQKVIFQCINVSYSIWKSAEDPSFPLSCLSGSCTNLPGSFECSCEQGWRLGNVKISNMNIVKHFESIKHQHQHCIAKTSFLCQIERRQIRMRRHQRVPCRKWRLPPHLC